MLTYKHNDMRDKSVTGERVHVSNDNEAREERGVKIMKVVYYKLT